MALPVPLCLQQTLEAESQIPQGSHILIYVTAYLRKMSGSFWEMESYSADPVSFQKDSGIHRQVFQAELRQRSEIQLHNMPF